jgi:tetratricopeptide (TPR) repeat protein
MIRKQVEVLGVLVVLMSSLSMARAGETAPAVKELYDSGRRNYNLGHFEEALKDFEKAYQLKDDPAFLFNIGQCQRNARRYEEAARSFRAYLRESTGISVATREQVQKLIAEMENAIREQENRRPATVANPAAAPKAPSAATAPTKASTAATAPAKAPPLSTAPKTLVAAEPAAAKAPSLTARQNAPKKPAYKRPWVWVVIAGTVVAVGAGVGLGVGLTRSNASNNISGVVF